MRQAFSQSSPLEGDERARRQLEFNRKRALAEDHTEEIDALAASFDYETWRGSYWNPESFSLLWGTALWDQSTAQQRLVLNHLYWVAYYSQIISAEIATIYFNQIAAAGLYGAEDFRLVCDTLDLESRQERAHVAAFKSIGEAVERSLFGERLFTYAMRGPLGDTMVFSDTSRLKSAWRSVQLGAYSVAAPSRPTVAAYYLLIRGLRTLNGKLVQERLARFLDDFSDLDQGAIPARISKAHFIDESYHFNTSRIVAHEIPRLLPPATTAERWAMNRAVEGCQRDHIPASAAINGIFWHDPALFSTIYRLFRSEVFAMDRAEALRMLKRCFGEESEGLCASLATHGTAVSNYRAFVDGIDILSPANREMAAMAKTTVQSRLRVNRAALRRFRPPAEVG